MPLHDIQARYIDGQMIDTDREVDGRRQIDKQIDFYTVPKYRQKLVGRNRDIIYI